MSLIQSNTAVVSDQSSMTVVSSAHQWLRSSDLATRAPGPVEGGGLASHRDSASCSSTGALLVGSISRCSSSVPRPPRMRLQTPMATAVPTANPAKPPTPSMAARAINDPASAASGPRWSGVCISSASSCSNDAPPPEGTSPLNSRGAGGAGGGEGCGGGEGVAKRSAIEKSSPNIS